VGRTRDRRGSIEALDTLDRRDLRVPHPARPGIDGGALVPGVDCEFRETELRAAGMKPSPTEKERECVPCRGVFGPAIDHDVVDQPALKSSPPSPDIDFDAILLDVGAGGQEETAMGHGFDLPVFATFIETLPVRGFTGLDPGLAEHTILEAALRLVGGRGFPRACDVLP